MSSKIDGASQHFLLEKVTDFAEDIASLKNTQFFFTSPMPVRDFLERLLPADRLDEVLAGQVSAKNQMKFMSGLIFFTHFVYVTDTPTVDDLLEYFKIGAAIICKDNQHGFDNIIPVLLPDNEISFILGQSKLHSERNYKHELSKWKMTPQFSKIKAGEDFARPYFCLHAEFGDLFPEAPVQNLKYADSFVKRVLLRMMIFHMYSRRQRFPTI